MPPGRDRSATAPLEVFAVEADSIQLMWPHLPGPEMVIEVGDQRLEAGGEPPGWYRTRWNRRLEPGRAGPGAVTVTGLDAACRYEVCLSGPKFARRVVAVAQTLDPGPGRELGRFATISDCHIGETRLGALHRLHDPQPRPDDLDPYPVRCATAAIAEAECWGAETIAAKGDLTRKGEAAELAEAAGVLSAARVPVVAALGNHDVQSGIDAARAMAELGFPGCGEARAIDRPGIRLVLGHSPVPGLHGGRLTSDHLAEMVRLFRTSPAPLALILHHPPRRWPINTYYPPSLSWRDSSRLMKAVAETDVPALVLAGHTHRNRLYRVGGVVVSEVGATKDYPGQWAGYIVYEGGIRQVVHRVTRPDAVAWTEMTRRAMGGVWGWWSPGRLAERCWTLEWPNRVTGAR